LGRWAGSCQSQKVWRAKPSTIPYVCVLAAMPPKHTKTVFGRPAAPAPPLKWTLTWPWDAGPYELLLPHHWQIDEARAWRRALGCVGQHEAGPLGGASDESK